jgi:WD40 repeat protein
MAFHPDSLLLATVARDGVVGLWNTVQGSGHGKIEASHLPLTSLAFSQDGTRLAVGGLDKLVRLYGLDFAG